jgi:hypothetical protein
MGDLLIDYGGQPGRRRRAGCAANSPERCRLRQEAHLVELYRAGGHTVSDPLRSCSVSMLNRVRGEFSAPRLARRPLTAAGDRRDARMGR